MNQKWIKVVVFNSKTVLENMTQPFLTNITFLYIIVCLPCYSFSVYRSNLKDGYKENKNIFDVNINPPKLNRYVHPLSHPCK